MTTPAKLKLTIYQGATFRKRLTWKGPLPAQTPIDLTGCTARMQVRPEVESSTVLLELTTANGGITLGGVAAAATAVAGSIGAPAVRAQGGPPIKIGLLTIDSGPFATYANLIEEAGADALELNVYFVATDPEEESGRFTGRVRRCTCTRSSATSLASARRLASTSMFASSASRASPSMAGVCSRRLMLALPSCQERGARRSTRVAARYRQSSTPPWATRAMVCPGCASMVMP